MKAYTDLEQSKKLAKILPKKSADMFYATETSTLIAEPPYDVEGCEPCVPFTSCWSLAALLNAVDFSTINLHYDKARMDWVASATIHDSTKHCTKYESTRELNPVDACVELLLKLHELNLL